jgi:hypothetical protein
MITQTGLPTSDGEYTATEIERELRRWAQNLVKAKADGDILGTTTALAFLDCWLDRSNALKATP